MEKVSRPVLPFVLVMIVELPVVSFVTPVTTFIPGFFLKRDRFHCTKQENTMRIEKQIADRIKQIRKSKNLTLEALGEKVNLSKGLLSRIENVQVSPPIATLAKIARGLNVSIGLFFEDLDEEKNNYAVTLKSQRRQIIRGGSKIGFAYYSLTQLKAKHLINPFIVKYPVTQKKVTHLFDHPGEEFFMVLKGEVEFVYGKETIILRAGDTIHFDATVPHRGQNIGKEESECLVIVVGEIG
jgi:transcriptional regulator with XRE-family HTH domain